MARENVNSNDVIVKYTKILAIATVILAVATLILAISTIKLSDSNEKLTEITEEFYRYHPPDIGLTSGYVAKLYVLRNNSYGTYITVLGIYSIYNSASSDDIALVRKTNLKESFKPLDIQDVSINDSLSIEGNLFPISIIPGESPKEMPILVTRKIEKMIENDDEIKLEIKSDISRIEVIHPTDNKILTNLTVLNPCNITFTMGQNTAIVEMNDSIKYNIDIRYTEDYEIYQNWKRTFLRPYGISSFTI